ncbi:MAG: hypothetical protein RMJ56_03225 [Gemmataceae bacterium]|nr:hypothetical protein [Gemmata sp.]MDW8196600.1 hypothetical protein [Gemmataceae bacterium]
MTLPRWLTPGAIAFVVIWLFLLATGRSAFFRDPGTFWHTTTGELILTCGFLRTDPYTFTFAGQWWVPYQWLGEVVMAWLHRVGGFDLQLLAAVTLLAALWAWLTARLLRTGLHPVLVAAVMALALASAGSHFHVRPHLFTLAAMAIVAVVVAETDVFRPKSKFTRLWWLLPLFIIWTNVHGGVLGGIGTLAITVAAWTIFWRLGRPSPVQSWREGVWLALLVMACSLCTLVSPYGWDLVKTWHVIMGAPELRQIIIEHRPLVFTEPYAWPVLGLAGLYLGLFAGVKRAAVRVSWLLPWVWLILAFSRCRHVAIFSVITVVMIAAMWKQTRWALWLAVRRPDWYQPGRGETRPWWANVLVPAAVVLLAMMFQLMRLDVPVVGYGWAYHDPETWPVEILEVLKAHEPRPGEPNKLFNSGYTDGGFVIYHAPGYKVFVDDRCELFGGPWLLKFVEASANPAPALAAWEARYGPFDYALTRTGTAFDECLRASPNWQVLQVTPTATFYRRLRDVGLGP